MPPLASLSRETSWMRMYSRLSTQSTSTSCVTGFLLIVPVITQCPVILSKRASGALKAWLCASATGTIRDANASATSKRRARIGRATAEVVITRSSAPGKAQDAFHNFTKLDLRDYAKYKQTLEAFRS